MRVRLQEMKWEEVEEALGRSGGVAIVPVGSTEQHGRHLPLGTDSFNAIGLAEDAARRTGAVVAPPIWFGWSPHHMWLPGTVTLRPEVLTELVVDVCRSLAHHGFGRIVIVNGHRMANLPPLQQAAARVRSETDASVTLLDPYPMSEGIRRELDIPEIGHGDEMETSHMLFLHPALVEMEKAVEITPPPRKKVEEVWVPHRPPAGEEFEELKRTTGGAGSYPVHASREKGEKLHNALVDLMVELIEDLKKR
ncbi:hypothetical protein AC482_06605 [miscellaneous Crenarchaeota group-15 archaeon DG-45]|uniref:Creatininase n=1 Tax=miscellaneous Crenarchaeota group-15 archaeon DG-45 TaxID=1685127 RepID=A0A0M0BLE3_9ARCH|nr:MAG: hypothetical protein AC482_06605 [miscellaneous Crenarchaeota group-15 archaeon DG-45]